MSNTLMAHIIPFFPDQNTSISAVEALVESGVKYLEIQFPFTDPTADGPTIEAACSIALGQGFTVSKGFAFVDSLRPLCAAHGVEIFIMTYASLVYARGVGSFVEAARKSGARGLIVPDLPPDSDEGYFQACKDAGLAAVPVVVPSMEEARRDLTLGMNPEFIYCALRSGITGTRTDLDPATEAFLKTLSSRGAKVFAGFGIVRADQVARLKTLVHACVVGSAIVRIIQGREVDGRDAPPDLILSDFPRRLETFISSLASA